jgi:hypothetical protein
VLIAADGASEYSGVNLSPQDWATRVKTQIDNWGKRNTGPAPVEIRSEIKRLKKLLISHKALNDAVKNDTFYTHVATDQFTSADSDLQKAYVSAYGALDKVNKARMESTPATSKLPGADQNGQLNGAPPPPASMPATEPTEAEKQAVKDAETEFERLRTAQQTWTTESLVANKKANRDNAAATKEETKIYLSGRIFELEEEIKELEERLKVMTKQPSKVILPSVLDAEAKSIEPHETKIDEDLFRGPTDEKPSPWTRITAKVSQSNSESTKVIKESASSFAAKVSTGLWSASGRFPTSASAKAMSSMSGLDVEISMDCMLVEIERPWLHTELFSDHELGAADGFPLSPGPEKLHEYVRENKPVNAKYAEFCSYPTAFVIATNVELEFSGNTTQLESTLESSSTEANLSVGYGPFSLSASHKQSKSKARTKAESTASGMRISLQAPQIIA